MKPLVVLILLISTLFAIPAQGEQYLTEAQKKLLLEKSRALGQASEKDKAQDENTLSGTTNQVKQQSKPVKPHQPKSLYLGMTGTHPTSQTSSVVNNARSQTQDLQSVVNNAVEGTPTHSSRSVHQDQRLANTAKSRNAVKPSRQVTTSITTNNNRSVQQSRQVGKTKKKFNWSGFFKGLGQLAEGINSGMNQTNSQQQLFQQQLRQVQENNNALMQQNNATLNQWGTFSTGTGYAPQQFHTPNACLGTIVNGVCYGTINPSARSKTCHGKFINGRCIGTVIGGD